MDTWFKHILLVNTKAFSILLHPSPYGYLVPVANDLLKEDLQYLALIGLMCHALCSHTGEK